MKRALNLFLSCWAVFVVALLAMILCTDQAELHQLLTLKYLANFSDSAVAVQDFFFKYVTEIGASIPFVVAGVLLFYKVGDALLILLSQGITALVVYPVKVWVNAPRPKTFFAENFPDVVLHQIDGVSLHAFNSFPSGHTAAAFSFLLCLTMIFSKKSYLAPLFFLLAVIAGYSRIYLSQHFAEDVCAGAFVGVLATLLVAWFYYRKQWGWEQKSLQVLLKK